MKERIVIYQVEIVQRAHPDNFSEDDLELYFPEDFQIAVPEVALSRFRNITVIHHFLLQKGRVLANYGYRNSLSFQGYLKLYAKQFIYRKRKFDTAICIFNEWGKNYFHWLTEMLPGIILAKQQHPTVTVLLPEGYRELKFVTDAMDLLDIVPVYWCSTERLVVNECWTMELPVVGQYHPAILHAFRTKLLSISGTESVTSFRKVYVSRSNANRRRVLNEDVLIAFLQTKGFEIVRFEELGFKEQIQLMQETQLLISIHGAGLSNLLFMQQGSSVIELKATNNNYNCFFTLARLFGLRYYYSLHTSDAENHRNANVFVSIPDLEKVLASALN